MNSIIKTIYDYASTEVKDNADILNCVADAGLLRNKSRTAKNIATMRNLDIIPSEDGRIRHIKRAIIEYTDTLDFPVSSRHISYYLTGRGIIQKSTNQYNAINRYLVDMRMSGELDKSKISDNHRQYDPVPVDSIAEDVSDAIMEHRYNIERLPRLLSNYIRNAFPSIYAIRDAYVERKWYNQPNYVEVWIEADGVRPWVESICNRWEVALVSTKGESSFNQKDRAAMHLDEVVRLTGRQPHILFYADFDKKGFSIPKAIERSWNEEGFCNVAEPIVDRRAGAYEHIAEYGLITEPLEKEVKGWHHDFTYQLETFDPHVFGDMVEQDIASLFDDSIAESNKREVDAVMDQIADANDSMRDEYAEVLKTLEQVAELAYDRLTASLGN